MPQLKQEGRDSCCEWRSRSRRNGSAVASGGGTGSSSMLLYIPAITSIVGSISVCKRKVHQTIFAPPYYGLIAESYN